MEYIMVQNRQTILLGPMPWRARFMQSELDDLGIDYQVPLADPESYIDVIENSGTITGIEIFPVEVVVPEHDLRLHNLGGPYYSYYNNLAYGEYTLLEKSIDQIRGNLKNIIAAQRYQKEVAGTTIDIQGMTVPLNTSREGRLQYDNLLNSIGDKTISFKTSNGFVTLDAAAVKAIIDTIFLYIQDQFAWEQSMHNIIDAAQTFDELKQLLQEFEGSPNK